MIDRRERWRFVVCCAASSLITAFILITLLIRSAGGVDILSAAAKYAAVSRIVSEVYVGEADLAKAEDAGYRAMVYALGDKWSYYMTAEELQAYQAYTENSYTGIGVTIESAEDGQRIATVREDSPAYRAGVTAGDIILAVDGLSTQGMGTAEVRALIIGAKSVVITLRDKEGTERSLTIGLEALFTQPVEYELIEGRTGYIKIANFETGSSDGFRKAVEELQSLGALGYVFDVRGNPGGKLTELLPMLDMLLPEGDIFVRIDRNGGEELSKSDTDCLDLPMAVLVDAGSYSAAEYFAAVLSEYGAARVVGERTTGKGRAQVTYLMTDGSAVHISNSVYLTPITRTDLSEKGGLVPDIELALDEKTKSLLNAGNLPMESDSQLKAALELIQ